jgi:ABC-type Na+ efflux pump permease subunit
MSGERAQQTLEVLLTTPLSARQIVTEKSSAMLRLRLAMFGALLMVLTFVACDADSPRRTPVPGLRVMTQVASALVVPSLLSWLAVWIGLRSSTHLRAVIGAVLAALAWIVGLPLLIAAVLAILELTGARQPPMLALLASPLFFVYAGEWGDMRDLPGEPWLVWTGACAFYLLVGVLLRKSCMRGADAQLRRRSEEG